MKYDEMKTKDQCKPGVSKDTKKIHSRLIIGMRLYFMRWLTAVLTENVQLRNEGGND